MMSTGIYPTVPTMGCSRGNDTTTFGIPELLNLVDSRRATWNLPLHKPVLPRE
jgi:hypothetical protein